MGADRPVIEASGPTASRVANLVVRHVTHRAATPRGAMSSAVLIRGGAVVLLEESEVSSDAGHCVVIQGQDSCGYVLHNQVARGRGVGVLVCDGARGVIEDNDIASHGRAGVAIVGGGDPLVCHNKIHEGMDSGVLVSDKGRGRVEDNDIFENRRAGVAIFKAGAPLVKHNSIHDGRDSGVLVCENGQGSVVDNVIFGNRRAGVSFGRGGAARVTGNTIRDGSDSSLCLSQAFAPVPRLELYTPHRIPLLTTQRCPLVAPRSQYSNGLFSCNVIHEPPSGILVPERLMREVQNYNEIRPDGEDMAD